jgi:hypothetical protein
MSLLSEAWFLPHFVKWLNLMMNVMIFDMFNAMKHIDGI